MSEAIAAEEGAAPEAIENPVELPEMDGPRYRTRDDFNSIPDHNIRRHAWQEYQRTIEEFRQTGTGQETARDDFALPISSTLQGFITWLSWPMSTASRSSAGRRRSGSARLNKPRPRRR